MRLITIGMDGRTSAAVRRGDRAVEIETVDGQPYPDVGALLRAGEVGLADARRSHEGEAAGIVCAPEAVRRPVLDPGAIICVGYNFRTHIAEMGKPMPSVPTLFSKLPRSLADPHPPVRLPAAEAGLLDYEGELAVVIGRPGRRIPPGEAWDHVGGLTVFNDVSLRDRQLRTSQWFAGKSWQGSSPIGPDLVTPDEVGPLEELELVVTVNGEDRQRASLGDLIFDVPTLVAEISRMVELEPGDIIATGTPGGVGHGLKPPRYLASGDVVDVVIESVGALQTRFELA